MPTRMVLRSREESSASCIIAFQSAFFTNDTANQGSSESVRLRRPHSTKTSSPQSGRPFAGSGVPRSGFLYEIHRNGVRRQRARVTAPEWWAHAVARLDANRTSKASAYTGAATRLEYSARPLVSGGIARIAGVYGQDNQGRLVYSVRSCAAARPWQGAMNLKSVDRLGMGRTFPGDR